MAKGPRITKVGNVITWFPAVTIEDVINDIKGQEYELMIENTTEYARPLQFAPEFHRYFVLSNEHLGRMAEGAVVAMANKHVISSDRIKLALGTAGRMEIFWLRSIEGVDEGGVVHPGKWQDRTRTLAGGYAAEVQGESLNISPY